MHLKPCTKIIYEDYTNESIQAASLIYENRTSPLTLLFSGGLDGEYMIRIFEKAKTAKSEVLSLRIAEILLPQNPQSALLQKYPAEKA